MITVRLLALASALALTGCESVLYSGYSAKPIDSSAIDPYQKLELALQYAPQVKDPAGNTVTLSPIIPSACFSDPLALANVGRCQQARDQAVAVLAIASDSLCLQHRRSIYGREDTVNVALGSLTNLFAGAAAIVYTQTAKSLYGALALFSNSERSLANETVYKQMIVTAVDQKIVESMDAQGATLKTNLAQPLSAYGIPAAMRDVLRIHSSCSFINGLRLALSEGTQGSAASKMLALRRSYQAAGADVDQACAGLSAASAASAPDSSRCGLATKRMGAISTSLQAAETAAQ